MKARIFGAVALGLLVAACGTNPRERVTGGAAAGAATGAGVGALGGPVGVLAGAGIGAAAGAATGAATSPDQVNLGRPLWNDPEVRVPGTDSASGSRSSGRSGMAASSSTRELQQALSQRGFDPGPADGVYGPRTRQAVMDWQRANNQDTTGRPNQQMLSELGVSSGSGMASTRSNSRSAQSERDRAYMGGGMIPGENNTGSRTGSSVAPGATMGGGVGGTTGNTTRPNPTAATGAFGSVPSPSNNPMNDPIGGSGANRPGLNNNSDGGSSGGGGGGSGR